VNSGPRSKKLSSGLRIRPALRILKPERVEVGPHGRFRFVREGRAALLQIVDADRGRRFVLEDTVLVGQVQRVQECDEHGASRAEV
jgi:hypothetical protein